MANITPTKKDMQNALINRIGNDTFNKLNNSVVAICGLGGLGSNIAISLARAGVGKLILVDFDKVDISNLNRQQYKANQVCMFKTDALKNNLLEIVPDINLVTYNTYLTKDNAFSILKDADVICEAFDKAENKAMLLDFFAEFMPQKYLVCGSGMAGLFSPNTITTKKLTSHIFISGDGVSDIEKGDVLYSSGAMLCAAHEAHTVLRILTNNLD